LVNIKGMDAIRNSFLGMIFNKNNDAYIATQNGMFLLINNSDTATQIDNIDKKIIFDLLITDNNDLFYSNENGIFVLKYGETTPIKIDGIYNFSNLIYSNKLIYAWDTDKKLIFSTETNLNWIKKYSNFNLVDKSKNIAWLRDDQLVANGQVKVKIANTDIETVKVNGIVMPSPDKKWDFDLPDTSTASENRDYNIEIAFKLDGKSYTGQIIVSSLLAQPNITVQKNTSPFGNIASYVYQVPTNDKVGDVTLTSDLYYSDTEVKVSLNKPTGSTVQSGVVYGLNEDWQKNGQQLDITGDLSLNATMLNSYQGRFLVETKDSADNSSFYYISLNKDNLTPNFWDTEQGQTFYSWANLNGYNESIKKLNATELNKIIKASANWQQQASDSQFATAVAEWFKTNGKLLSKEPLTAEQVIAQLKTQIPNSITIPAVNTSNYDVNKVKFELNKNEFKPNDKVNITVKYNNATSEQFTLQIKDSNIPNKLSNIAIAGIAIGSVAGVAFVVLGSCYLYQYLNKKKKQNKK
ncbi:hypothetical protein, partial [Spiroplasma sp. hyd1]|uniref:hypothetical protein n=1 Tax=Spiroplasma sp. hyd1 TaxID=1609976 RepID=UPI0018DD7E7F